jgi:LPXTG-motif cell wall-anchored protein
VPTGAAASATPDAPDPAGASDQAPLVAPVIIGLMAVLVIGGLLVARRRRVS